MKAEKLKQIRYQRTLDFFKKVEPNYKHILDLGVINGLSDKFVSLGYNVQNTRGEDLDIDPKLVQNYTGVEVVTAFEILEHLVSPYPLLKYLPANRLVATVPLSLWFSKPYRNINDKFDWHYHEFEPWQFDMLLEKAGWEIDYTEKWTAPTYQLGVRPLLRFFYPRYYAVHAIRRAN